MSSLPEWLTVGELARRSGVATSALRFYESKGLLNSERTPGNQRRFHRSALRRVAVIRAAQSVGLTLQEITSALGELPEGRNPTKRDWQRLSTTWQGGLEQRITELQRLRDELTGCIGCGCLSLETCGLLNAGDAAAGGGTGPRYLLGDSPALRSGAEA